MSIKTKIIIILVLVCFSFGPLYAEKNIRIATFNCEFLARDKVHKKFGVDERTAIDLWRQAGYREQVLNLSKNSEDLWGQPDDKEQVSDLIREFNEDLWSQPGYREQTLNFNKKIVGYLWEQSAYREKKFNEAVHAVAGFVKTIDADILVLTELGPMEDFRTLIDSLVSQGAGFSYNALCDSYDSMGQHIGILSNIEFEVQRYGEKNKEKIVIPGRKFYQTELADPWEKDIGINMGMHIRFEMNRKSVHLFAVQLKSQVTVDIEEEARKSAQASIVRRNYLPFIDAGDYVIVVGDLNDGRGEPVVKKIRGLDDIYPDLIQTGCLDYFKESEYDQGWTYYGDGGRQQIDHILISRNIKADCKKDGVETSVIPQEEPLVSDHRPLIVDLRF
ncbi:MAG: hypothetical protein GY710_22165 [Desulfobacteraceae bacterium]|nr:hypothetical protein [Desulfobacteraceae bacterium]